jgi:hypothetical protein
VHGRVGRPCHNGLPANLFYSTGIPVCILVLKKCKYPDDVLFINAAEHFVKGNRQNQLTEEHIAKIVSMYQKRPKQVERYARRVEMKEIEANDFNLNISRYISTAEAEIDLAATHPRNLRTNPYPEKTFPNPASKFAANRNQCLAGQKQYSVHAGADSGCAHPRFPNPRQRT